MEKTSPFEMKATTRNDSLTRNWITMISFLRRAATRLYSQLMKTGQMSSRIREI